MKLKIGDKVRTIQHGAVFYSKGAVGTITQTSEDGCLVEFVEGEFMENDSKNSWYVALENLELYKKQIKGE